MNAKQRRAIEAAKKGEPEKPKQVLPTMSLGQFGLRTQNAARLASRILHEDLQDPGRRIVEHGFAVLERMIASPNQSDAALRAIYLAGAAESEAFVQAAIERGIRAELAKAVPAEVVKETTRIRDELDLAVHTADVARDERRQLELAFADLSETLRQERQQHQAELAQARMAAQRERDRLVGEIRELNEARRQLRADLDAAHQLNATLNAQLDELTRPAESPVMSDTPERSEMTEPEPPAPALEVPSMTMQTPTPDPLAPTNALERMSWHAYQKQHSSATLAAWRGTVTEHVAFCRAHLATCTARRSAA